MGNSPYDYIMSYTGEIPSNFVHRTFNNEDLGGFFSCLNHVYTQHGGLESAFSKQVPDDSLKERICAFRARFFQGEHVSRTQKHVSNPASGSASKRLIMFIRVIRVFN
jgi:hypothetical protein